MVELNYDLHIHSCLSPCGDEDMTPANIAGMAMIKGLDVIALTDHNSCKNCEALSKVAKEYGVVVIPGMELTTSEEVHVLCFFSSLALAMEFDAYVASHRSHMLNHEEFFGRQLIMNEKDEILGKEPELLITSTEISFLQVHELVKKYKGIMVPAHIDKNTHSLFSNLGFVPEGSQFHTVEMTQDADQEMLLGQHPYLQQCRILCNSDAHYLGDIHEAHWKVRAKEASIAAVLEALQ